MRAEIQMRSSHLFWVKYRLASEMIDLQELFNDYWSSNKQDFTLPSQSSSLTGPLVSDGEAQRTLLSMESIITITGL